MRIINQSRTRSINFENCEVYIDGECICTNSRGIRDVLGRYKTPERAKEVFEEMHHASMPVMAYNNVELTEEIFEEISKTVISVAGGEIPKIENNSLSLIYRMPEK